MFEASHSILPPNLTTLGVLHPQGFLGVAVVKITAEFEEGGKEEEGGGEAAEQSLKGEEAGPDDVFRNKKSRTSGSDLDANLGDAAGHVILAQIMHTKL